VITEDDLKHLEWLTENRSRNQRSALELYRILKLHPMMSHEHLAVAHLMVGISFSLWRAVFLGDFRGPEHRDGDKEISAGAEAFLEIIIRDNAIGFPQDKSTREWTFGYYVGNAQFRLRLIHEMDPSILSAFKITALPPVKSDLGAPKWLWEQCQSALDEAMQRLGVVLSEPTGQKIYP
jgi:hypothetical protein